LATAIKRKISQRAEGADFAYTVSDPEVEALCAQLSHLLRHRGNLDVDVIRSDGEMPQVLERNARFGGGYPFSHLAGARFPRALVQLARGDKPDPGRAEPGVYAMLDLMPRRFDPGTNHCGP
jgi:carbamoyl-phosphate synthase large subunit